MALYSFIGVRDHLSYNRALWQAVDEMGRFGAPISQTDGGYVVNGWLQYAHPENAPRDAGGAVAVPMMNVWGTLPYVIANRPLREYRLFAPSPTAAGWDDPEASISWSETSLKGNRDAIETVPRASMHELCGRLGDEIDQAASAIRQFQVLLHGHRNRLWRSAPKPAFGGRLHGIPSWMPIRGPDWTPMTIIDGLGLVRKPALTQFSSFQTLTGEFGAA